MAFRKRNIVVSSPNNSAHSSGIIETGPTLGTRPSPLDGRSTISTGTRSLDSLLAGHSGIVLGTSLLIEEGGTTDFGGILLRYFAAEGVVQGHRIHVLGMSETWGRDLPGISDIKGDFSNSSDDRGVNSDKMKIAWRYERLGEAGRDRASVKLAADSLNDHTFCHDFDLSERLVLPSPSPITYLSQAMSPYSRSRPTENVQNILSKFLQNIASQLALFPKSTVHRIIIPGLLSPAVYPTIASTPEHILRFLHSLRALLRKHPTQLTALITLPLTLYPRNTGLTRWLESINDGVIELAPFPGHVHHLPALASGLGQEEAPQGILKVHRLPILYEKGEGASMSAGFGDDLAFTLSRRKGLVIKPFSLPPVDGENNAQHTGVEVDSGQISSVDIEF